MNTHVITQEDYDVNPIITQLGLNKGDTISFEKAPLEETPAPADETPADETV